MVNTDLTGINGVSRSLLHSKITRQQQAINLLSETGSNRRDSLSISDSARSFSKKSIAALIDKSTNVSASELSFYFANYDNSGAILDAINFGENVSCGYNPDFKEYGVISFDYNGSRQIVPNYAVPKINTGSLSGICAVNNSLVLNNKSYYSWTTSAAADTHGRSIMEKLDGLLRSHCWQRIQIKRGLILSGRCGQPVTFCLHLHRGRIYTGLTEKMCCRYAKVSVLRQVSFQ